MTRCSPGLAATVALLCTACTVGPNYVRPSMEVPAAYKEAQVWKPAEPRDAMVRGKWWEIFGDADLSALMERIEISNQNLRIAESQVRQARALVEQARAGLYPQVSGGASVRRGSSSSASGGATTSYELSADAGWELDVWGRIRRSVEANVAGAQASAADLESARLSAQAALAQNYFLLRIADAQQRLLEETSAAYERTLTLTQNRYAAGVAAKVDVVQAQTQMSSTRAQAIDLGVQRAQNEHAIALLVGESPSTFAIALAPLVAAMPAVPAGLPSQLLERRPDIASAERRVAAANAQIGVAIAAYYPAFTLSAAAGLLSGTLSGLLSAPTRFWSVGPALAQTLFDAGLRRARTDQARAAYEGEVAFYRQTVLSGFQEVEDNLAALRILEEEGRVQDEAVRLARDSVALTTNQYKAGTVSYVNVVAVQTVSLNNERTAVGILGRRLAASVGLVKALGGGWDVAAPRASSP